jgi:hypothetical protein
MLLMVWIATHVGESFAHTHTLTHAHPLVSDSTHCPFSGEDDYAVEHPARQPIDPLSDAGAFASRDGGDNVVTTRFPFRPDLNRKVALWVDGVSAFSGLLSDYHSYSCRRCGR